MTSDQIDTTRRDPCCGRGCGERGAIMIDRDHKQRMMGALYEAMFRIRSTVNDHSESIQSLFTQSEAEEVERIATIADATINRLMKIHDAEQGVRE